MTDSDVIKRFNRICTPYFGYLEDDKEKVDVFFEPIKFQKELETFLLSELKREREETFSEAYLMGSRDGKLNKTAE